jgi:hypothetical protein
MFGTLPMALFALVAQAPAAQKPVVDQVVQVGLFSYRPDGADQAAAYETNLSTESTVYVAGCAIGGGNRPAPDRATEAWRLSGKVLIMGADEAVIQLDWQRTRANGAAVSSPGGSVLLTLHPGDRVPLDSVTAEATPQCAARNIGFEARYGPQLGAQARAAAALRNRGSGGGGIGGTGVGSLSASGGGFGSGTGSGTSAGTGTGSGGGVTVTADGVAVRGRQGAVHIPKSDAFGLASRQFDVDLWLVRNAPGRNEEAVHQELNGARGGTQFAFAPVNIDTPRGPLTLQVTGSFQVKFDESGALQLVFVTMRNVKLPPAEGPARDARSSMQGSSVTTHAMPGPDDVLSFEMPPLSIPNGASIPDRFSIRLRIR